MEDGFEELDFGLEGASGAGDEEAWVLGDDLGDLGMRKAIGLEEGEHKLTTEVDGVVVEGSGERVELGGCGDGGGRRKAAGVNEEGGSLAESSAEMSNCCRFGNSEKHC